MKSKIEKDNNENKNKLLAEENNIMVAVYHAKESMHTDQTGKFPHVFSRGNKYQMILIHIDTDSIWVEAMKTKPREK